MPKSQAIQIDQKKIEDSHPPHTQYPQEKNKEKGKQNNSSEIRVLSF